MQEFTDRIAVVTGAGSGIGRALALACAEEGMDVVVADLEADAGEEVAEAVRARGRRALAVPTDVSKRAALDELAKRTWDAFGACHLLCNNAGVLLMGSLETCTDADWAWILGVNLQGVIHGIQAFLPRMLELEGERHILNTASISGLIALPNVGLYATSKYAVVGLSESLRVDLARHGIGVSVLCPGGVQTRIFASERNRPGSLRAPSVTRADLVAVGAATRVPPEEMIDPGPVARAALEGVRDNDAYILTHARYRGLVERRHQALLSAFDRAEQRSRAKFR